ncbi:BlaI/MecI/CopY family transcriptional regulator [Streptomyces sp. NBC_01340]|uniref:BlaI/MecI/CopY family transcriptional regulator n=2 Tax=Streptomyces TaxID=1883 RepID=UPI0022569E6F|nr:MULTISPECIES: BlaI/MecI/CopY family transcriptional regulator [unclassified Streptomyces]MCX4455887.1 BlaI/MecI/CopY family transcriptional regulator [Streptomyces sp. NBC_01719]MCX4495247.1 BlaI/MecI/CopY family transcriptional regulator [Streptomyces sp. NBC_01728]WSI40216.1 BlaI/MecI/CopY family transcriptional regulator [Streptomyces sp. NBC_01340]
MPRPLGELEDAVMTRVWKWNRPVTVREVLEDLQQERSIAYTTVMTVLDNLHQKGWVRREAEGRAYRYEAVSTRAAYAAALMNDAWSQSDNPAAALVAFFGMMSEEQRRALRDAVRIVQGPEEGPEQGADGGETRVTPDVADEKRVEKPLEKPDEKPDEASGETPGKESGENPDSDPGGTGR